jgi:hypothetical protein
MKRKPSEPVLCGGKPIGYISQHAMQELLRGQNMVMISRKKLGNTCVPLYAALPDDNKAAHD